MERSEIMRLAENTIAEIIGEYSTLLAAVYLVCLVVNLHILVVYNFGSEFSSF